MIKLKNKLSNAFYILLVAVLFTSCKQTYYEYDLNNICKACKEQEGVNRFYTDLSEVIVICKNGKKVRLK